MSFVSRYTCYRSTVLGTVKHLETMFLCVFLLVSNKCTHNDENTGLNLSSRKKNVTMEDLVCPLSAPFPMPENVLVEDNKTIHSIISCLPCTTYLTEDSMFTSKLQYASICIGALRNYFERLQQCLLHGVYILPCIP